MFCRWISDVDGKRTLCWQKGKAIRKSECVPCLLARTIQCLSNSQARKKAIWIKKATKKDVPSGPIVSITAYGDTASCWDSPLCYSVLGCLVDRKKEIIGR